MNMLIRFIVFNQAVGMVILRIVVQIEWEQYLDVSI